ncbi:MAG: FxLYD domain-containing protein [Scytolyngbya sp. HA4215-MV1]|jgi:hypothetical protein|nr:FxLYD domain-containing protein [Scytolyngbya sp. HA4215-MV1]
MLRIQPLFLLAIGIISSVPHRVSADPLTSSRDVNASSCYMQTTDGRILDLTALCTHPPVSHSAKPTKNADVLLNRMTYDGRLVSGQLTNRTDELVKQATITYQLLDNQGNPVDTGIIKSQPIAPGGTVSFQQTNLHPGAHVQVLSIDWAY